MTGYRISDAAQRTGLTASALRFYEKAGVLSSPHRTPSGYRLYDERDLSRLTFLAQTRELGLALDDVRDLLPVWDDGSCQSAQVQLRQVVTAKLQTLDKRIAELTALRADLADAASNLGATDPGEVSVADGCGPDCGCMTATAAPRSGTVPLTLLSTRPADDPAAELTVACTLGAGELPPRLRAWQELLSAVTVRKPVAGGVQVELPAEPSLTARVAELVALKQQCCSFFTFTLTVTAPGRLLLTATAPDHARPLVEDLLGAPA